MKAYSPDLRKRVIHAVRRTNLSQSKIAKAFSVSPSTVENWWRSWQSTKRTAPLPYAGGVKRILQPHATAIRRAVKQQPDATLAELCATVEATTTIRASASMICRELQILNLPRKKVTARQSTRYPARAKIAPSVSEKDPSSAGSPPGSSEIH